MSNVTNILWLSDIHFSSEYSKTNNLESFIEVFIRNVKAFIGDSGGQCIDYIFITGDLAQKGLPEDYNCLHDMILCKLLDVFRDEQINLFGKLPKLVTIPGNHDLSRHESAFFKKYIQYISDNNNLVGYQNAFLASNKEEFGKMFENYYKFLNENQDYADFLPHNDVQTFVSPSYEANKLYGYVIDHKKRVFIILLNTAWFSQGDNFDVLYSQFLVESDPELTNFIKESARLNDEDIEEIDVKRVDVATLLNAIIANKISNYVGNHASKYLRKLLRIKNILTEYNTQITGIDLLWNNDFERALDKYSDYVVITCMHHPLNWMGWDEIYRYERETNETADSLKSLIFNSDILLTGHEHVPVSEDGEIIENNNVRINNAFHLKSGCFIEYKNEKDDKFKFDFNRNWFSILTIDTDKYFFNWTKYQFRKDDGDALLCAHSKGSTIELQNRRKRGTLTRERFDDIQTRFETINKIAFSISAFNLTPEKLKFEILDSYTPDIIFIKGVNNQRIDLIVIATREPFYKIINTEQFFVFIDKVYNKSNLEEIYLRFLVLDFFVSNSYITEYKDPEKNLVKTYSNIVSNSNVQFDVFRHSFFDRFENGNQKLQLEEYCYSNIKIINKVVPYWSIHNFID